MIDLENRTQDKIDMSYLEHIAKDLSLQDIELIITNNDEIKTLNKKYRNIDKSTDVLSFPLSNEFEHMPLGTIIISSDFVKEKAKKFKHSFQDELALLFIHGLLHLLKYDHEIDNGEHRKKEEEIIKKFNLPNSLIVRNS